MLATKYSTRQRYQTPSSEDSSDSDDVNDSDLSEDIKNRLTTSMDSVLKYIVKLTSPQIISLGLCRLNFFINIFFISLAGYYNLETFENTQAIIKGVGLANIIIYLMCYSISFGLNGALETLISFTLGCARATNQDIYQITMRRQCGQYLNIARLVNTLFMIFPTVILFLFADEILISLFKQNAFVSEIAIQYCIISMPGIWAMTQFDATKRFLSA